MANDHSLDHSLESILDHILGRFREEIPLLLVCNLLPEPEESAG